MTILTVRQYLYIGKRRRRYGVVPTQGRTWTSQQIALHQTYSCKLRQLKLMLRFHAFDNSHTTQIMDNLNQFWQYFLQACIGFRLLDDAAIKLDVIR